MRGFSTIRLARHDPGQRDARAGPRADHRAVRSSIRTRSTRPTRRVGRRVHSGRRFPDHAPREADHDAADRVRHEFAGCIDANRDPRHADHAHGDTDADDADPFRVGLDAAGCIGTDRDARVSHTRQIGRAANARDRRRVGRDATVNINPDCDARRVGRTRPTDHAAAARDRRRRRRDATVHIDPDRRARRIGDERQAERAVNSASDIRRDIPGCIDPDRGGDFDVIADASAVRRSGRHVSADASAVLYISGDPPSPIDDVAHNRR